MKIVEMKNKNNEKVLPDFIEQEVSNSKIKVPSSYAVNEAINSIDKKYKSLGSANNQVVTITLKDSTLDDYRFLCVSSGWGYNKSIAIIPVSIFKYIGPSFLQCNQYVKTYSGSGYTNIQYVDDTSFIINGAVGADTVTTVYGIK